MVIGSPFIHCRIICLPVAIQHNEFIMVGTGSLNKTRQFNNKSEMQNRSLMASGG
jgi:hypothetical protein